MGNLLAIVLPLACGAAVSPTVLALQLLTLSRRDAPLARSWAVAAGCALVLAGLSVVALLVARSTGGSDSASEAGGIVKLAAAALLVVVGVRQLRRPPAAPSPPRESRHPLRQSFALGAAMMVSNFSTIVLYFPAMHAIGIADAAFDAKVVAFLLLFAITLLAAVGPPLVVTLMGDRATPALERLDGFFAAHRRGIGAGICFAFAVLLAVTGLHAIL